MKLSPTQIYELQNQRILRELSGGEKQMARLLDAANNADWMQVWLNGGPPCFHVENDRFCLRTRRWAGHKRIGGNAAQHKFVPLESLLRSVASNLMR